MTDPLQKSEMPAAKSCADFGGHIWNKNGTEPIQVGAPCVCGEEAWDADEVEWPPDGLTPEESVYVLFQSFVNSHRERK